jgi:hypothetical protein
MEYAENADSIADYIVDQNIVWVNDQFASVRDASGATDPGM